MPAQSTDEVKQDLIKYFDDRVRGSAFFEDYAKIASFLSDPAQYRVALAKLEQKLLKKFNERVALQYPQLNLKKLNVNDHSYLQKQYVGNTLKAPRESWSTDLVEAEKAVRQLKKLLTAVLGANELKHGFNIVGENTAVDIIVGLPAKFNDLLKARRPFKDIGAGHAHGEYSHRIQWFLVSQMTTLDNKVVKIYEKLPGWFTKNPIYRKPRNFYMWEFLVDRDGVPTNADVIPFKTTEQVDFRAPSNVNRWLSGGLATFDYPWLNACMKQRWDKRAENNLVFYVAKKLLGIHAVKMSDIKDEDFLKIHAAIDAGIMTRG